MIAAAPDLLAERDRLRAEVDRRGELLGMVIDEALHAGTGYPDSTPNAAGSLVSVEPSPPEVVAYVVRELKRERDYYKRKAGQLDELREGQHTMILNLRAELAELRESLARMAEEMRK